MVRYKQVKRTTWKHLIGRTRKSIKEFKIGGESLGKLYNISYDCCNFRNGG